MGWNLDELHAILSSGTTSSRYMTGTLKYAKKKRRQAGEIGHAHNFSRVASDHVRTNEGFYVEHSAADKTSHTHVFT